MDVKNYGSRGVLWRMHVLLAAVWRRLKPRTTPRSRCSMTEVLRKEREALEKRLQSFGDPRSEGRWERSNCEFPKD
jgi:hypothetical protein